MIASASRNLLSITTILPRSICCTSPEISSRIAVTTSVVLAIGVLLVLIQCESRVAQLSQAKGPFRTAARLENHGVLIRNGHDASPHPAHSCHLHVDVAADELCPMPMPTDRPLDAGARDFEHVAVAQRAFSVQPLLQRPADPAAGFDRDLPWRTVDSDLNERPVRRAADPKVGQIEAQRFEPAAEGLDETLSEHGKKSAGRTSPASRGGM